MARFNVFSASAGAGKTYSLVLNFLKICLRDEQAGRFRQILAITFTNKAANEMKERLVKALQELSSYQDGENPSALMQQLCKELEVSPERLRHRAERTLKTILHQYSAFSVSTIDRFTNRLIRSFARDLQLNTNYEVELDNHAMLAQAIDDMLAELQEDSLTTRAVLQFVDHSLTEGRSPRPEQALQKMGANLFSEEALPHLKKLRALGPAELLEVRDKLYLERAGIEKGLQARAEKMMAAIDYAGLRKEHFSRGTVYDYLQRLAQGDFSKWTPSTTVKTALENQQFHATSKKDAQQVAALFEPVLDELLQGLEEISRNYLQLYPRYHLAGLLLKDIYTLSVLTEIDRYLQQVKENTNRLPIGEFNKLISEKLEMEPAGYIFEKLGERYHHFFIDEFQDTSRLQWKNLLPLINNAMAAEGSVMIVGDGKQSIYRWRGGEVEQFIGLSTGRDPSNKTLVGTRELELYERKTQNLPANFRSRRNIVEFNNSFFQCCAPLLMGGDHQAMYLNENVQQVRKGEGGYVELQLLEGQKEEYAEAQCARCLSIVKDALERGYELSDIAILVRSKSRGSLLAEYFLENGIPVISPDSLGLQKSPEVRALVSFLTFLTRPDDHRSRYDFLEMAYQSSASPDTEKHRFLDGLLKEPASVLHQKLGEILPRYRAEELLGLPLSDKVHYLCQALGADLGTNPFLHAFVDLVENFERTQGEDLAAFVRWWEQTGSAKSLALPEGTNAVQIMTIHKSKGLQFKVTVLAFADWRATFEQDSRAWMALDEEQMHGLPSAWLSLKDPKDEAVDETYRSLFEQNKQSVYLDNLNLLYVAMTRAVDELYVLGGKSLHQANTTVHRYLHNYLKEEGEEELLRIGEKIKLPVEKKVSTPQSPVPYQPADWREKVKVAITAPFYWQGGETEASYGKKVHAVLAELNGQREVKDILKEQVALGWIMPQEVMKLEKLVLQVTNHPQLNTYYGKEVDAVNENDILVPKLSTERPDRVVTDKKGCHIIDYKTGLRKAWHPKQVEGYREVLSAMGHPAGENILVYLNDAVEIEKW